MTAGNYVILAMSGISTVPNSVITGDIGVSSHHDATITSTAMTGFSLTMDASGEFSTSTQVVGKASGPDYLAPTPAILAAAVSDMEAAYIDMANRVNTDFARINPGAATFGSAGNPLTPGVYTFTSGVTIPGDITFSGSSTDIFIIQIAGNVVLSGNKNVILSGGARAENIFWQIAGNVMVEAGAHMKGILLVKTDVTFATASSLSGRVLAQTACNLQAATITEPM
jgi:hypothetical protein